MVLSRKEWKLLISAVCKRSLIGVPKCDDWDEYYKLGYSPAKALAKAIVNPHLRMEAVSKKNVGAYESLLKKQLSKWKRQQKKIFKVLKDTGVTAELPKEPELYLERIGKYGGAMIPVSNEISKSLFKKLSKNPPEDWEKDEHGDLLYKPFEKSLLRLWITDDDQTAFVVLYALMKDLQQSTGHKGLNDIEKAILKDYHDIITTKKLPKIEVEIVIPQKGKTKSLEKEFKDFLSSDHLAKMAKALKIPQKDMKIFISSPKKFIEKDFGKSFSILVDRIPELTTMFVPSNGKARLKSLINEELKRGNILVNDNTRKVFLYLLEKYVSQGKQATKVPVKNFLSKSSNEKKREKDKVVNETKQVDIKQFLKHRNKSKMAKALGITVKMFEYFVMGDTNSINDRRNQKAYKSITTNALKLAKNFQISKLMKAVIVEWASKLKKSGCGIGYLPNLRGEFLKHLEDHISKT